MKILVATGVYPPESGGPATHTKLMEERLPALGFEVRVLPFRTVRHLPKGIRHLVYLFTCMRMARGVDIIFAQDTVSVGLPAAIVAWLLGKKFVVRVPGDYAWEQGKQRFGVKESLDEFVPRVYGWRVAFLHSLQKFTLTRATRVISPSAYLRTIILRWGIPESKVPLIYNGIEFPVSAIQPSDRPDGFLIVTVGRLVPWKGIDRVIEVVSREPSWKAVIVDNGPDKDHLHALVTKLGIQDRIRFVGNLPRAEALGWVETANVFVLNSSYEGLSHLLIEAMALGAPIVATAVGGNPELIRDKQEGLLIPPYANDALHDAIMHIAHNTDEAKKFSMQAAERAKEFSIDNTMSKTAALLQTI